MRWAGWGPGRAAPPSFKLAVGRGSRLVSVSVSTRRSTRSTRPGSRAAAVLARRPVRPPRTEVARQLEAARLHGMAQMASHLGHEINNTLAAIVMRAEVLAMDVPASAPARESIEVIEAAVQQGVALVGRVRELARLARPLTRRPVDLAEVVDDALAAMGERLATTPGASVVPTCTSLPVLGDRAELALAVRHLLANALDAMPNGGNMRVETGAQGDLVCCHVVDSGTTVEPEALARGFEPFYSTRAGHGRGLGLTIALTVAVRHGGDVQLTPAPGGGTIATLRLPRPR